MGRARAGPNARFPNARFESLSPSGHRNDPVGPKPPRTVDPYFDDFFDVSVFVLAPAFEPAAPPAPLGIGTCPSGS